MIEMDFGWSHSLEQFPLSVTALLNKSYGLKVRPGSLGSNLHCQGKGR